MGGVRTVRLIEPKNGPPLFLAFVNASLTLALLPVAEATALKTDGSVAEPGDDAPFVRLGFRAMECEDLDDDQKQVQLYLLDVMHQRLQMSPGVPSLECVEPITFNEILNVKSQIMRIAQAWSNARRHPLRNWDQEEGTWGGPDLAKELLKDAMGLMTLALEVDDLEPAIVSRRRGRPKSGEAIRRDGISLADTTLFTPFWSLYQYFRYHPRSLLRRCALGRSDDDVGTSAGEEDSPQDDICSRWFMAKKFDHKYCSSRCRVRANTIRACSGPDGSNADRTKKWRNKPENEDYFRDRYHRKKGRLSSGKGRGR